MYSVEKEIIHPGPLAVCPNCGHRQTFLQLPLFVITGPSGSGKSTLSLNLVGALRNQAVVLDADILWRPEFENPQDDYRRFRDVWLRLAKNISQSGLPVILAGTFLPEQIEELPERRYFSALHFLGLVADDDDLKERLKTRPAWRESGRDSFVGAMVRLNGWLKANADSTAPPIELLDTSELNERQSVIRVVAWFRSQENTTEVQTNKARHGQV
jgi:energy-coupling factor transporter ATP-binding protein EcfA2